MTERVEACRDCRWCGGWLGVSYEPWCGHPDAKAVAPERLARGSLGVDLGADGTPDGMRAAIATRPAWCPGPQPMRAVGVTT